MVDDDIRQAMEWCLSGHRLLIGIDEDLSGWVEEAMLLGTDSAAMVVDNAVGSAVYMERAT